MLIDDDVIDFQKDISDLTNKVAPLILSANRTSSEFNRTEVSLKEGRLCLLPYLIARPEQLTQSENRDILINSLKPLINYITEMFPGYTIVRGELVNLLPGKSLVPHIDIYWFHKMSRRIHLPIVTNADCKLTFEDRPYHLEAGKIYEINNRIMHSGYNNGQTERVHLILDFMEQNIVETALLNKQNFLEVA